MKIITRSEARALGLKRYFTGKPCKHGHVAERNVSGNCTECLRENCFKWRARNPDFNVRANERWRERYANDPDFRARQLEQWRKRYASDPDFRAEHSTRRAALREEKRAREAEGQNP
jgi:hypothetical protein